MKKGVIHATLTLVVLCIVALFVAPSILEDQQNVVNSDNEWPLTDAAKNLHKTLRIADLHADTLLWDRDFLERSNIGHLDLPRLQEGGVVLQILSAVTKSPRGQNYDSNSAAADDNITLLAMLQLWPTRTWDSLLQRALYQSEKLYRAADTAEQLFIITSASELESFLDQHQPGQVATLLATEGAHPLEGDLANLTRLWQAGYRMLGLHHFFDNRLGGSLHGESRQGLTDFGKAVLSAAVDMGFIIDVAHSSAASVDDVLALNPHPVVISHTGIQGTCDSPRNLQDNQLQRIAAAGGLIGVGYWDAVCDITPPGVATSIAYAVELLGAQHVALGSDYDGTTTVTFDTAQLNLLTQALQDAGLSDQDIRLVMGENQLRFLTEQLP